MTRFTSPRLIVALGLLMVFTIAIAAQQRSTAQSMTTAATSFLASLNPEQRQQATFAFDSAERLRWHFVPQFERNGLQIKAMTEPQRKLAHDLLKTGLSARGYDTYTKIMQLENILRDPRRGVVRRAIPRAIASRCSARQPRRAPGAGASSSITSRCTSTSSTERRSRARRHLPARILLKSRTARKRASGRWAARGHRSDAGDRSTTTSGRPRSSTPSR